jgi:hypothetical protein
MAAFGRDQTLRRRHAPQRVKISTASRDSALERHPTAGASSLGMRPNRGDAEVIDPQQRDRSEPAGQAHGHGSRGAAHGRGSEWIKVRDPESTAERISQNASIAEPTISSGAQSQWPRARAGAATGEREFSALVGEFPNSDGEYRRIWNRRGPAVPANFPHRVGRFFRLALRRRTLRRIEVVDRTPKLLRDDLKHYLALKRPCPSRGGLVYGNARRASSADRSAAPRGVRLIFFKSAAGPRKIGFVAVFYPSHLFYWWVQQDSNLRPAD